MYSTHLCVVVPRIYSGRTALTDIAANPRLCWSTRANNYETGWRLDLHIKSNGDTACDEVAVAVPTRGP